MPPTDLAADPATTQHSATAASPASDESLRRWPGYEPLTSGDSKRLLGRDDEIAKIVRTFSRPKSGQAGLVWLHGASGCGKTSLIQAGICPALKEEFGGGFQAVQVTPENNDDPIALIEAIAGKILSESPDEDGMALDLQNRLRQFSLMHGQDSAESAEYLASCYKRSRPPGVSDSEKTICLIVIDELDRFAPAGFNFLPEDEAWQKEKLNPLISFLHELILTGIFPVLAGMRSLNMESVKSGLTLCDLGTLGTWIELESPTLESVNPFFRKAPAQLIDSDHVNVEPMLLDALVEDAGSSPMGIPFVSETLRRLSELDPAAEDLSTADAGFAGGISKKFAEAADGAVPDEIDDIVLGELMLSLQRRVKSGSQKGETYSSAAKYGDLIQSSDLCRIFVDDLVNARVLHLTGNSLSTAEVQWSVPDALHDWKRASHWLKEEDRRLVTASRFEKKRTEWEKEDRTPVLLEHATHALNDARNLLVHHERRPFLSDEVIEFLNDSLELDQRLSGEIKSEEMGGKIKKWGGIAAIVIVVLILIWFIFFR